MDHLGARSREERRAGKILILLFAILAFGIVTAGYFSFRNYERRYRRELEERLLSIADLKVSELQQYRRERLGDAHLFTNNASFASLVKRVIGHPEDSAARADLQAWLGQVQTHFQYDRVILLDSQGALRMTEPVGAESGDSLLSEHVAEVMRLKQAVLDDFHRHEPNGQVYLSILVPILDPADDTRVSAVLVLRIDPRRYLYPLLQRWPTPSQTAETLLVRCEADEVVYLTPLRFREDAPLALRKPLENTQLPAVQAVLGREGIFEGIDYRSEPVIAALRRVPDSPWYLVARMDEKEVLLPVHERLWVVSILTATMLLSAAAGVGFLWHRQRVHFYKERYHTVKRLRALSLRHEALLAAVPDILMEVDANKIYTWANEPGRAFFGDDVLGKEASFYFEGEQNTYEVVQPLFNGDESVFYLESWQRRKDGQKRLLAWWSHALKDEQGKVIGALSSARDITGQKQAEEALRESEEKFRNMAEQLLDLLFVADTAGELTYVSPAARQLFGWEPEDAIGRPFTDFLDESDVASAMEVFRATMDSGRSARGVRLEMKRKDSTTFTAELNGSVLYRDGKVAGAIGSIRDITERKRAEEERARLEAQLLQAQKMEAVGQLAGGIAHDFNNLLQVISGHLEMVLNDLPPEEPPRAELEEVQKAAERAAALTRQLLAFSRRQVLDPRPLDLNEIVADLMKMITRMIGEHIELNVIPGHALKTVRADRGQLDQVLINLCVNARDAMPGGGRLTIETENVIFDEEYCAMHAWATPGRYVMLQVSDSGCGMAPEMLGQIFEPFFTTKEPGRGTGLGLATVYGIVRQHSGTVQVYSEVGKGSTFKVYLPAVEDAAAINCQGPEPIRGGHEKILVAEDDSQIRSLAKRILESAGYHVSAAADGEEALRVYREEGGAFDLLLLDVVMPHKGGRAVFDSIRKDRPDTRCLFVSGYSDSTIHTDFILEAGLRLLQKPYQRDGLLRAVRAALDR